MSKAQILRRAAILAAVAELILGGITLADNGEFVEPVSQATVTMDEICSFDEEFGDPEISYPPPLLPIPGGLPVPEGLPGPEKLSEPDKHIVFPGVAAGMVSPFVRPTPAPYAPAMGVGYEALPDDNTVIPPIVGSTPAPYAPAMAVGFEALIDDNTTIPPDTNGAVGPSHLMVPLNSQVRIQQKNGAEISIVRLESFWSSLGVTDVFDPKVIYDPDSERFIFVTCAERRLASSSMLLGVSATSDPTGSWYMWQLDGDASDTYWVDYPNIGVNSKWITFTSNMFTIAADTFSGVNIWAVDKSSALDGGELASTLFFETGAGGTHVPCLTFSSSETTQYLVNVWNNSSGGNGYLRLYTITGNVASPQWTATDFYPSSSDDWSASFIDAPQQGTADEIETNEDRMMNAVLRNGSLWCTHMVALPTAGPTRIAAKWWQIDPTDGSVTQSGVVEDTITGMFYYFPSITVNVNNEVLLGFTGSSSSTYAGGYYTYRNSDTAVGEMESVSLLKAGEATYYKTFSGASNRWGDFSATCVDPTDDATMWTIQQYAETHNDDGSSRWGTWWGATENTYVPPRRLPPTPDAVAGGYVERGGSGGKVCFIATAAYGTPMAEEVKRLSLFRDRYLLTNKAGRAFVRFYYKYSPAPADFIRDKEPLRAIIRIILKPLIRLCKLIGE